MTLKVLDLFSGIGGFSYAAERLVGGFETTQFVEIDPYCQRVLHKNFPNVPIHHDITEFNATEGQFDVITAGFPCQAYASDNVRIFHGSPLSFKRHPVYKVGRHVIQHLQKHRPRKAILECAHGLQAQRCHDFRASCFYPEAVGT